jgi:nicotinate dehydrogenase subunit B
MSRDTTSDIVLEPERYELRELGEPFLFDRRAFLRAVGGGLVVLCLLRDAEAQQRGRGRGQGRGGGETPREIGAWLHIAEDGAITAYTGKAEVGQNARTSLTQAVADELRVGIDAVTIVMADTARVPFDMGTFGSRTTPSMVPQLRRAAAAARGLLVGWAAEHWGVDRAEVEIADGKATHARSGKSLDFGALTKGRRLVEAIAEDQATTPPEHWQAAGRSAPKVDGRDFVTGRHRYSSDITRPGLLHGKVLRPPAFGATLAKLDAGEAETRTGVAVVRDGDFVGVVAPDEPAATRALGALRAEWTRPDEEPPSNRTLFDYLAEHAEPEPRGRERDGSIDDALGGSDVKLSARYTVAYIAHAPLEPRAAVAEWDGDRLTVWTGTQRPFGVRGELARAFNIPEERVRVIVPDTGSGYGGKHTGEAAIEAARLARAARAPVKLVWTREEETTWAYFRPAGVIDAKVGARKDGTLSAWEFVNINSGGSGLATPYEVAARREAFQASRSPLRQGSYRALAATANHFARESLMDELAHALGIDPLAFRRKNLKNARLRAVLDAATERFGWSGWSKVPGRGIGLALGTEKGGYVATCAEVSVDRDSGAVSVVRAVAAFECGAVINPDHLRNQVEGCLVMGLGGALFEAIEFAAGRVRNARFSRYRVPRFGDVPEIDVVLLDRKDLPSAGAGETPIVAIAPAIGNAIFDATGIRLRALPLVPDGLKAANGRAAGG